MIGKDIGKREETICYNKHVGLYCHKNSVVIQVSTVLHFSVLLVPLMDAFMVTVSRKDTNWLDPGLFRLVVLLCFCP